MKRLLLAGCILSSFSLAGQFIPLGSVWRYYDLAMAPPNQSSTTWKQHDYDDSSWESGPAELGYGDGDEATVISSATLTAYYRHTFEVNDPEDFDDIIMQLTYDDGAVIYLNGVEVWRVNMPAGTITYNTFASSTSAENAQASLTIANPLVTGTNLLAVEVHQRSASSSDLSFNFSLDGVPGPGVVVITRGPYLQKANDTSMVVRYRTNIAIPSALDFGLTSSTLNQTVLDPTPKTEHVLQVQSLDPATVYYYQIRNEGDTLLHPSSDVYFKTYPVPGTATPLTAWILGDCGTGNGNARNVRNAYYDYIGSAHTDMILFLGDNAYNDGTDAEYQTAIFQNMYEEKLKNTVSWSCLGNHDGHSANSNTQTGPYYDIFTFPTNGECGGVASGTEAYYSFDYGNIHFIVLDSYETDRGVGAPMHDWCEDDLQNTMAKWIIALWHHPAYSKGSHNSDTESALVQMRQNFLPLFEDYGVDLVLSGHSHSYERTYFLNGHYGLSSTFDLETHAVGVTGPGSGQPDDTGAYFKAPVGPESGVGAVYITTGSSGKTSSGPMDHPAMYYDAISLGSCVLEIQEDTLSVFYLRQTGAVDDHFTLIKSTDCIPDAPCDDLDPCTVNDVWDNHCYCRGEYGHRYVTNSNSSGVGSLQDAIASACEGDTIHFMPSVTDTIRLEEEITVIMELILLGTEDMDIVISGQDQTRIFYIAPDVPLVLSHVTLYGGHEAVDGGAVLNDGMLILDNVSFIHNQEAGTPKAWTNRSVVWVKEGINYIRIE